MKRGNLETVTEQICSKERCENTEDLGRMEGFMMQPQAKDAKDASKAPEAGRGKKGFPSRFPRACGPDRSLILDF